MTKYKTTIKSTIYACMTMTAVAFASCDNIAEDDRLIYVKPAEIGKNVLIEDFTGQRCMNCPDATETIHSLQEAYGADKVIAVGLYSGAFGKKVNGTYLSLTTETGDYYYNYWKVETQPCLNVDRKGLTSDNQILQAKVTEALQETTPVTITATSDFNASDRKSTVTVDVESSENIADAKLQVWLTEDSIIDAQIMPTGKTNREYVHNHVFRTTVTDRDGMSLNLSEGKKTTQSFTATVDDSWVAENMNVIVIVSDSEGVKQTMTTPLVNDAQE